MLTACGSSSSPPATTTTTTAVPVADCPLTGTPAPRGMPARPAIAMKVDNYSLGPTPAEARPQSGLDYADVVFEEQVEGSITRYAAVFQCHAAPGLVGNIRSARQIDIQLLSELSSPLLVHVGGITPVIANIDASTLQNVDLGNHPQAEFNPPGRYPPYADYTTTQAIWKLVPAQKRPPAPIFTFSATPAGGRPLLGVHLDWSGTSDIYWRWSPSRGTWLRSYNVGSPSAPNVQPDVLTDGVQNQGQNVVIQIVHYTFGPWLENDLGGLEAQAQIANNSGRAYVLRSGRLIAATWTHGALTSPTVFTDASGHVISLSPGRTWVEVYPDTAPIAFAFPPAPAG